MKKKILVSLLAFLLTISLVAISSAQTGKPIKIAHIAGTTGATSMSGQAGRDAMMVWQKVINKSGGILGRPVLINYYDDAGRPANAVDMLKRAVYNDGVEFITTTDGSAVMLAEAKLAKELKTVTILSVGAAEVYSDQATEYSFRTAASSAAFGYMTAKLIADKFPNIHKIAGINPDYEWGHSVWKATVDFYKKFVPRAEVVAEHWPAFMATDYRPYISAIMALPDAKNVVVVTSLWAADEVSLIKQAKGFGFFDKIAGFIDGSTTNIDVSVALGKEMVPMWGNAYYYHEYDTPGNREFVEAWQGTFGRSSVPSSNAGQTYASGQFLEAAIKKAGKTDTMAVIRALEGLSVDTVLGPCTMREHDHQVVRKTLPFGYATPNDKLPFYTWTNVGYIPIPEDEVMPASKYKGWKANR